MTVGALLSYAAIAFNIVSGFLYIPWMIRTIGDDQYALYTLAISIIQIFLLDFGIGSAVTKFLSNYYARNQWDEAKRFMGIVYKVFAIIAAVIAVVLLVFYFLIDTIYVKLTPDEIVVFKHLFVIVAVYSVVCFPFTTFNGTLMANECFISLKACTLGQRVLTVVLIVLLLLMGQDVYALVLVNAFSNVVFVVIKYFLIKTQTNQRVDWRSWDKGIAKNLFGYSAWFTVRAVAHRFIFNVMPSLIAVTINAASVTVFSIATTLEGYVFTFADAINGMFMPQISRILAGDNVGKKLTSLMIKIGRFHLYTIGLIFVGFVCFGQQFITLWMGEGYEAVYGCTILLILPNLVMIPQQVANTALLASDVVKEQGIVYAITAIINVALAIVLLPWIGVYGAGVSVCVAYFVRVIGMNMLYRQKLPIRLGQYFSSLYVRWIPLAVIAIGLGLLFNMVFPLGGWVGLACKAVIFSVGYLIALWVGCMTSAERRSIVGMIRKRLLR